MGNATEVDNIGKLMQTHSDVNIRKLGQNLQGMFAELRKAEQTHQFLKEEGGDEAVAEVLWKIEAKRQMQAREASNVTPFPTRKSMHEIDQEIRVVLGEPRPANVWHPEQLSAGAAE